VKPTPAIPTARYYASAKNSRKAPQASTDSSCLPPAKKAEAPIPKAEVLTKPLPPPPKSVEELVREPPEEAPDSKKAKAGPATPPAAEPPKPKAPPEAVPAKPKAPAAAEPMYQTAGVPQQFSPSGPSPTPKAPPAAAPAKPKVPSAADIHGPPHKAPPPPASEPPPAPAPPPLPKAKKARTDPYHGVSLSETDDEEEQEQQKDKEEEQQQKETEGEEASPDEASGTGSEKSAPTGASSAEAAVGSVEIYGRGIALPFLGEIRESWSRQVARRMALTAPLQERPSNLHECMMEEMRVLGEVLDDNTRARLSAMSSEATALEPLPRMVDPKHLIGRRYRVPTSAAPAATPATPQEIFPGFSMPEGPPGAILISPLQGSMTERGVDQDGAFVTVTIGPDLGLVAGVTTLLDARLQGPEQIAARTAAVEVTSEVATGQELPAEDGPLRTALGELPDPVPKEEQLRAEKIVFSCELSG